MSAVLDRGEVVFPHKEELLKAFARIPTLTTRAFEMPRSERCGYGALLLVTAAPKSRYETDIQEQNKIAAEAFRQTGIPQVSPALALNWGPNRGGQTYAIHGTEELIDPEKGKTKHSDYANVRSEQGVLFPSAKLIDQLADYLTSLKYGGSNFNSPWHGPFGLAYRLSESKHQELLGQHRKSPVLLTRLRSIAAFLS